MLNKFQQALPVFTGRVGVALSGGGDSVALCCLLLQVLPPQQLVFLHFNHNLRADAATDADWVRRFAEGLGVHCEVGLWAEPPQGNVQQAARRARYSFFYAMQQKHKLDGVLVAHTANDVAETFLIRLARGSGVQGLAAMAGESVVQGVRVWRPLLAFGREELRIFLRELNQNWLEDVSNSNDKFLRIRIRNLIQSIDGAGLSVREIIASAAALRRADAALEWASTQAYAAVATQVTLPSGCVGVQVQKDKFLDYPDEIQLRVLAQVMLLLAPAPLVPRTSKRLRLMAAIKENNLPANLGGVRFEMKAAHLVCVAEQPTVRAHNTKLADKLTDFADNG